MTLESLFLTGLKGATPVGLVRTYNQTLDQIIKGVNSFSIREVFTFSLPSQSVSFLHVKKGKIIFFKLFS